MQTIHLMDYHLGGAPQGGAASEAPTLPDAGRPHVYSCDIDPTTLKVVVKACVDRAGEVKDPDGELEYFDVEIPEKYTGIVHKYNVKNDRGRTPIKLATGTGEAPVVNGESVPLSIELQPGKAGVVYSPVSKFELNAPLLNGGLEGKTSWGGRTLYFMTEAITLSRTSEGYLMIERSVTSTDT